MTTRADEGAMKANLSGPTPSSLHPFPPAVPAPRPCTRARSSPSRATALAALALAAAILRAGPAHARPPSNEERHEPDPFDLFLERAGGEHAADDAGAGSLLVGATASFQASSWSVPSFDVLGFVQVPLGRLHADHGRASPAGAIAERPAAPSKAPTSRGAPASAPDRTARPPSTEQARSPADREAPPPADPSAAASSDPSPPASMLTSKLARGAVRAACKTAKLDDADARLDSLSTRAKVSALLPELRLRATRAIDETESLAPTEYDPARRTASGSATTWLEARATFRLDRLVFADDELAVERQRMARAAERTRLVTRVLELLDAWQRARFIEDDPEAKVEAKARASLAEAAAEASLDVLTDGWFSRAIEGDDDATPASRDAAPAPRAAAAASQRPAIEPPARADSPSR